MLRVDQEVSICGPKVVRQGSCQHLGSCFHHWMVPGTIHQENQGLLPQHLGQALPPLNTRMYSFLKVNSGPRDEKKMPSTEGHKENDFLVFMF